MSTIKIGKQSSMKNASWSIVKASSTSTYLRTKSSVKKACKERASNLDPKRIRVNQVMATFTLRRTKEILIVPRANQREAVLKRLRAGKTALRRILWLLSCRASDQMVVMIRSKRDSAVKRKMKMSNA
jgi:hypothetical protein